MTDEDSMWTGPTFYEPTRFIAVMQHERDVLRAMLFTEMKKRKKANDRIEELTQRIEYMLDSMWKELP